MAESVKVPQIYGLIGKAIGMIGAIGKDSEATNYSGKKMYNFRGIDAVYNALNPVMSELGLFIVPEVLDHKREERLSNNNTNLIYSIATVRFTMYAPDGSSVQGVVIGEGMDSGDKSMNKAMSIAMKYFCFQVFCIPTEEMKDPDAEVHEVKPKAPAKQVPVKQDAPAKVDQQATIPNENPVLNYIGNEQKFMAQKRGITDMKVFKAWFSKARKSLIDGGIVQDIPATDMNMEQAKELITAVYLNCMGDVQ